MQRYSKKRQLILDYLQSTKSHPSAETVYAALKPEIQDLSLATVYRNLSMLCDLGLIRRVGTVDGQERYDATVSEHPHVVCTRCGRVCDIEGFELPESIRAQAGNITGFNIKEMSVRLFGICPECNSRE